MDFEHQDFLKDRKKSINPPEKLNPAIQLNDAAKNRASPVNNACTRYKSGATNMNANSIGSVTPVKKLVNPAATIIETILALFSGLEV